MSKIAVIGGGSWATALTKILSENGAQVGWWLRHKEDVQHLLRTRHNARYLSSVAFDLDKVLPSSDLEEVVEAAEWVVLAVPAAFVQNALEKLDRDDLKHKRVISAIKGMIPSKNVLVTDYVAERFRLPHERLGIVAGPCHAEEVALEKQSYLTIGAWDMALAEDFCQLLRNRYVKASPMLDLDGIEYCAVMKNIIALTCGIAHGLGYGDNFQAVLVSNAVQEIRRFVHAVNPQPRDLSASAYLGDLLVTAYSQFSRNRTFGSMIGRGYSVKSAQLEMNMVAEGYYAVKSIHELNKKLLVNMPIALAAYRILYEKVAPAVEIELLKEKFR
ncbi:MULTISPECIES: NAD(P)H-dependent glycerol-3-phosphate dehydrogenase [Hymenobacter]|uniref:Glycerol-3-phosphate dehydrogenase [NAD(P)+] n=1 Tax=Hymenobacter jejuensis TaxID=2502781 RepID=A0A5B8A5P7_9BACT|nr:MULTISPECIES: NAD(P)H-dependent glycerol-3-phosphate dehydrogenase [Hymenobacter]MBC6989899.1 NAD(P)H-dependent glycerol-3-phosphate dehydrogenase [Hymenobacter sp. BT491]QDA61945.1 NAD(P)H-dependent glycerol-3-phosphate dehydrogenase [Hymenobacter jejuensis]